MLVKLVRPLVRSQLQILAQVESPPRRLVGMVSQWLGYLGVEAKVTQLETRGEQIQVSLCVSRPEQCSEREWKQILNNLNQRSIQVEKVSTEAIEAVELSYEQMSTAQQRRVQRLLACVIQAGNEQAIDQWNELRVQLGALGLEPPLLQGIRSALKIPGNLDLLLPNLEPRVAAYVLSKAIAIALLDQRISANEDMTLKALYDVLEAQTRA